MKIQRTSTDDLIIHISPLEANMIEHGLYLATYAFSGDELNEDAEETKEEHDARFFRLIAPLETIRMKREAKDEHQRRLDSVPWE
jgi:hypothetical protein